MQKPVPAHETPKNSGVVTPEGSTVLVTIHAVPFHCSARTWVVTAMCALALGMSACARAIGSVNPRNPGCGPVPGCVPWLGSSSPVPVSELTPTAMQLDGPVQLTALNASSAWFAMSGVVMIAHEVPFHSRAKVSAELA